MSHTTSDARKRRDSTVVAHQPGWSKEPHPGAKEECDRCAFVAPDSPTVPRVARSVDDLRVGQWIATRGDDGWEARTVCDSLISVPYWDFVGDRVVILADAPDPPARDWLVPATQMEALREAMTELDGGLHDNWVIALEAARAVLDAARKLTMSEALCQCGHAQMSHFGIVGQGSCQINVGRSRCQCVKYAPPTREPIRLTDEAEAEAAREVAHAAWAKWILSPEGRNEIPEPQVSHQEAFISGFHAARLAGGPTLADAWLSGHLSGMHHTHPEVCDDEICPNPYRTPESEDTE